MRVRVSWFLAALAVVAAVGAVGAADYKAEIEAFRAQQEERLRSETGWLAMDLPLPENRLNVRITAGELKYHDDGQTTHQ